MKQLINNAVRAIPVMMALLFFSPGFAWAADFYAGKTIRIVVGFGPGGGYDAYARLLSRHLGDHIPGHPSIVVENMDGAGSLTATNYVYSNAPKDGTVLGAINQNIPMYQLLGGNGAHFDVTKFNWIGAQASSSGVIFAWHTAGINTLDDAKKREVLVGGTGTSADSYIYPTIVNYLTATKFKVVNGYKGSADVRLAMERGEMEARFDSWASLMSGSTADWIKDHKIEPLVQIGLKKERDAAEVPLLIDVVKGADAQRIARLISTPSALGYTIFASPEVPASEIAILRAAFDATVKDPGYVADAGKTQMLIRPQTGAEIGKIVASVKDTPSEILKQTAEILGWNNQ